MKTAGKVARTVELDEVPDLVSFLPGNGFAWLREHEGFVAWGETAHFDAGTGAGRFQQAAEMLAEEFGRIEVDAPTGAHGPIAFGSFTFDPERFGSILVIPEVVVESRGGRAWVTAIDREFPDLEPLFARSKPSFERVRYSGSSLSEVAWLDAVARAIDVIGRDELEKVVLARDVNVWSEAPFDLPAIVARLALRFPGCFTFMTDGFLGASPERLVERASGKVRSTVLAGSAPRGGDETSDARKGRELLDSAKDATEHELAVASVREVLGPLCDDLHVDGPHLLRLANVQHLATDFIGTLRTDESAIELAGRLHPTAAVGGVPRTEALNFIREVEGLDRARYSGPVGWVDASGDGEWAIALRCAELEGARGRLFAGAGVVEGSLPEAELEETRLKLRAMESVLGDG